MERSEPALVPEWLKGGSITGGGSTTHHHSSTLQSDEPAITLSTRNRSSVQPGATVGDYDIPPRSSAFADRTSAFADRTSASFFCRSSSSNGSFLHEKDPSIHSRPYSSFGRNNRAYDVDRDRDLHRTDRERDRERDLDFREKDRSFPGDIRDRDHEYADGSVISTNLVTSRAEKEILRRSQSMISGKRGEVWPRRLGNDLGSMSNGLLSGGGLVSSIHKAAFERDFPSLGAEEKQGQVTAGVPDISRVASPGLSTAAQSLPMGTASVIGGDGWTSALAEVPIIIGSNSSTTSASSASSMLSSLSSGLNMAETLAQAPSRARVLPQLSVETQRLEELAIKQSRQLIPMTPMPKTSVLSPSEKPKPKSARSGDSTATVKLSQQPTSQLANPSLRGHTRSDVTKTSQPGKLLVLKAAAREKNGISPTVKDGSNPGNSARAVNSPTGAVTSATLTPARSPNNPKPSTDRMKAAGLAVAPSSSLDKRSATSQAQNRSDFFNSLRRKTCANLPAAVAEPSSSWLSSVSDKSDEHMKEVVTCADVGSHVKDGVPLPDSGLEWPNEDESGVADNGVACEGSEKILGDDEKNAEVSDTAVVVAPEEEEAAFLRSLGWEENGGEEEGLTEEEISAFYKEYMKLKPSATFRRGMRS